MPVGTQRIFLIRLEINACKLLTDEDRAIPRESGHNLLPLSHELVS